jgi:class 3 adenylate cyclase
MSLHVSPYTLLLTRFSLHASPYTGIIGRSRYQYDVIGDIANKAARMMSSAAINRIQMTEATKMLLELPLYQQQWGKNFEIKPSENGGRKNVKGFGEMNTVSLSLI